ncbi:hypothetical protein D3C87_1741960 [compost metagenome]
MQAAITKFRILVNGDVKTVSSTQLVYKGTTYVPIRETAKFFGYNTNYNPYFDSIEFAQKNGVSNKWLTLIDFTNLTNYQVTSTEESPQVLKIVSGRDTAFSIDVSSLKHGSESAIVTTNNKLIHIKYSYGAVLLSKEDLKAAGYNF